MRHGGTGILWSGCVGSIFWEPLEGKLCGCPAAAVFSLEAY